MVHAASPYGPWSEPVLVLKANTSIWDNHTVLIDTNLAVTILPDGSAAGIWRKCENTPGTVCEHQCCTFPHLLTASDWRDPSSYVPHSDAAGRLFGAGLQPYGSEDPMLWQEQVPVPGAAAPPAAAATGRHGAPPPTKTIVHAILHDEQGPSRCTAFGRHAFSANPASAASWVYALENAYDGNVTLAGGATREYYRAERPHIFYDQRQGRITHLSNGVQETTSCDRSYTLIQPLAGQERNKDSQ